MYSCKRPVNQFCCSSVNEGVTALRIERRHNLARRRIVERDIQMSLERGPVSDPVCVERCPDYDPCIGCSRKCGKIPVRLSSDPDFYPLEPAIAPLVFELKRLGVFFPCWSCEGHNDPSGILWKLPRVWFYAESVVLVRALSETIDSLFAKRQLIARWQVVVTYSDDDNIDTTFSLEPVVDGKALALSRLQTDISVIASNLADGFLRTRARLTKAACEIRVASH